MQQIISIFCFGCKEYRAPELFEAVPTKGSNGPYRCKECRELLSKTQEGHCSGCGGSLDRKGELCKACYKLSRTHARVRIATAKEKYCSKCNRVLPIEDFGFTVRRSDGRNSLCKQCHMEGVHTALAKMQQKAPGTHRANGILRNQEHRVEKLGRKSQTISSDDLANLWENQEGKCYWCKKPMNPFDDCTLEHIKSLANGGTHTMDNISLCCNRCNHTRNKDKKVAFELYLDAMFSKVN